jgi:hypothetical protein
LRQNENGTRKTVFGKRPKLSLFRIVGGIMTKTSETLAPYPQIAAAPQRHGSVTKCGCWQFNGTGPLKNRFLIALKRHKIALTDHKKQVLELFVTD